MASRALGTLTLDLVAKIGGFEQGMDRAARTANRRMGEIEKRALAFGKVLGAGIVTGAAAAATAITAITKQAIDYADHLNDLNERLGISAEALSGWAYAAQQTGTDIDALGVGLKKLAKNMAEALDPKSQQASLFKALGVDVKDAQGNLRDLESVLPEIASKFKELDNATTEAALAQELFGKSGTDLLEFLNQGEGGLDAMRQRARELGVELGDSTLKAADEFNDRLSDLKSLALGVGLQLAEKLLPELNNLVKQFTDAATEGGKTQKFIEDLATSISGISKVVVFATEQFAVMVNQLAALRTVAEGVIGLDWSKISQGFRQGLAGQQQSFNNLIGAGRGQTKGSAVPPGLVMEMDITLGAPLSPDEKKALEAAVNGALAGGGGGSKRTGKSEAERQAERTAKAINQMKDALRDWETELAGTGNPIADEYAKRLSDITEKAEDFKRNGIPAKEIENFKTKMQELAAAIKDKDLKEFQKEFTLQTKEMVAQVNGASTSAIQYTRAMDELNKQLKAGAINQEEFNSRAAALAKVRDADSIGVLRSLKEEKETLGLSSDQLELYYNLKRAGTDASAENIKAITAETKAMQEQRKALEPQIQIMDSFREGLEDTVVDVVSGNKSISDAFKNLFDDLAAQITRWIAKKLIAQAFGDQGTVGQGGGWGQWIGTILGAFAGGGRAAGGFVSAGSMYRVNENGPELLSMGNRDYLMMGAQSGRVSPAGSVGGATYGPTNIYVAGTATRETIKQIDRANARRQIREARRT